MINYNPVMKMNKKLKGSLVLLLATTIWGTAFVAQDIGMDAIGPFTFQATRCFLAILVLLPISLISDRRKKDGKTFLKRWTDKTLWKAGILCGIFLFIACNLQQLGIAADTGAGKSAFLTAMYIIFVPIIGLIRGKKMTWTIPVSVLTAVAGLYFLSCVGVSAIGAGDLMLLGCAVAYAVQITFVDIYVNDVDAVRLSMIQALVCTVFSAILMFAMEKPTLGGIWDAILPLAYAGCLSMGFSYTLQIIGQKDLEPSSASLIMSMESVFAVLAGAIILHERLSTWEILGCVLVFAAVIISQLPAKAKTRNA